MLSDDQFINQFQQKNLDPAYFNHLGHVRLTWLYLNRFSLDVAIKKVSEGISGYATSLGATDKFHATLTGALVNIIDNRCKSDCALTWPEFIKQNNDLVENARSLIALYYTDELLDSEIARAQFLAPDLKQF